MNVKYLPLLVGLILGVFNFLEKTAVSKYGVNYQEAAAIKFTTAAIVILVILFVNYSDREILLFSNNKLGCLYLILSGIFNAVAILLLYYCFKFLDVSFVTPLYSTVAIIFISILGVVFLKEHLDLARMTGILFCLAGIFLITHKGLNP